MRCLFCFASILVLLAGPARATDWMVNTGGYTGKLEQVAMRLDKDALEGFCREVGNLRRGYTVDDPEFVRSRQYAARILALIRDATQLAPLGKRVHTLHELNEKKCTLSFDVEELSGGRYVPYSTITVDTQRGGGRVVGYSIAAARLYPKSPRD